MGDFEDTCQTVSWENSNRTFPSVYLNWCMNYVWCRSSLLRPVFCLQEAEADKCPFFFFLPCAFWHHQTNDSLTGKTGAIFNKAPLRALPTPASGGLLHCELLALRDLTWVLIILLRCGKPLCCCLSLSPPPPAVSIQSWHTRSRSHSAATVYTHTWGHTGTLTSNTLTHVDSRRLSDSFSYYYLIEYDAL